MSMRRSRRLRSQRLRSLGPEIDPLKLSMDWTPEDLEKPQILVDDVWGDALPGSYHLLRLSGMVCRGVYSNGGKPANFHITDMCDGIAQGTEGMDYSLLSREVICDMIEVHWRTQPLDGMVLLSSCDKGVPAQLKAMARMYDAPAIHVPGGTMMEGPGMFTLERVGTIYSEFRRNELSREDFQFLQRNACPTVGCCSFMGTANTMQAMSEALASSPELHDTTALVTDGRFSGASRGPCVGYVSPEAMEGGPIAIVEKDDLIEIDIPGRGLNLVGVKGKREDNETMEAIIRERLAMWKKPPEKYGGVLGLYTRLATSAMDGGYMDYGQCQVR